MSGATDTDTLTSEVDPEQTLEQISRQPSSNKSVVVPTDNALLSALAPLRTAQPALGAAKLHTLLLQFHPEWIGGVSEKRTRRVLGNAGLAAQAQGTQKHDIDGTAKKRKGVILNANDGEDVNGTKKFPTSRMLETFDVTRWSDKIAVHDFGRERGKGLVATKPIEDGEVLWKEDAWVVAPEWEIYDFIQASAACTHCSTPFNSRRGSISPLACPSTTSSSRHDGSDPPPLLHHPCPARFCNRLCLQRGTGAILNKSSAGGAIGPHTLLCPSLNPASVPLDRFARGKQWLALKAWAGCIVKVLLANEREGSGKGKTQPAQEWIGGKDERVKDVMEFLDALAIMDPNDRARVPGLEHTMDPAILRTAHQYLVQALHEPLIPYEKKKLSQTLRTPLSEELTHKLFSYDSFVRGIVKMGLNIEAHGGLYVLHSHLNHHCSPNLSARHLDTSTCLSRVSLVARRKIEPGEELLVTYTNPEMNVQQRKAELRQWGIECECKRCVEEEALLEKLRKESGAEETGEKESLSGLEKELKEGLGLF